MNILLSNGFAGTYELSVVKRKCGTSIVFQSDWDFPGLARTLGWNGKIGRERCEHRATDGTVICPDCGKTASEFIGAAAQWLDKHDGHVFRGKGEEYFQT